MTGVEVVQNDRYFDITFGDEFQHLTKILIKNIYSCLEFIPVNNHVSIDLIDILENFNSEESRKIHLLYETNNGIAINQREISFKNKNVSVSNLKTITFNEKSVTPFITENFNLQLTLMDNLPLNTYHRRNHIDSLKVDIDKAVITGKVSIKKLNVTSIELMIKNRIDGRFSVVDVDYEVYKENKSKLDTTFKFKGNIGNLIKTFIKEHDAEYMTDIFLSINTKELDESLTVKIGRPRSLVERFLKGEFVVTGVKHKKILTPYFTLKGRNLSFYYNELSDESYETYKKIVQNKISKFSKNTEDIWIIGEKIDKAQDNGFHLFKYLRMNYPDKKVYYIIDKDAPEVDNVINYGNVIFYQSPEHFEIMPKASYVLTTHHPEHIFPSRNPKYINNIKAKRVFLQHGVLGLKNLQNINGKQLTDFNVDLFLCSSEREKEIIKRDLLFDENEIAITGLSRFDNLFKKDVTVKKQILIIPTWRDWIFSSKVLLSSEYYDRYMSLLRSTGIKKYYENGYEIVFCLHPNMQAFKDLFDIPEFIKSVNLGDIDVQLLIKESQVMITDYSSVAFDFSFLNKPVIYYQFDLNRFLGKSPSHLNVQSELPGYIVQDETELFNVLNKLEINEWKVKRDIIEKSEKFLKYKDRKSNERIIEAAMNFKPTPKYLNTIRYDIISQRIFNRYRKSNIYFPSMRAINKILTTLTPVKEDLIVFESNIGKSVADSPKVIYDELKKYNHNYKVIWVNNKVYPFNDPRVKIVKRLSPSYYYYLSKAKYWVNNQKFPHYVEKNKNTTYIQTWHGTPLKKMLNDIENIQSRDEGYQERITNTIKRWDYLVSPSDYATKNFRTAFQYDGKIIKSGYPRNDQFFKNTDDIEDIIKKKLSIPPDKKVILYAPTFRDDETLSGGKHGMNLMLDLEKLKLELSDEYVLLLRPHIIIANKLSISPDLRDFVFNVAKYNDIADLLLITDILVTDYSSVMFDFSNTGKPMLFYTYDLDHYMNNLRGFYMDFEKEAPGPFVFNTRELIESIKDIKSIETKYATKYNIFKTKYNQYEEGHAAQKIVREYLLDN